MAEQGVLAQINHSLSERIGAFKRRLTGRIGNNGLSQEEFFAIQTNLILVGADPHPLYFYGYDVDFMEREGTKQAIRESLAWKERSFGTSISAIITEREEPTFLEELVQEMGPTKIRLVITPDEILSGFTVYGMNGVGFWDSTKPTIYLPERNKGVIFRKVWSFINSPGAYELAYNGIDEFEEMEAKIMSSRRYRLVQ